MRAILLSHAYVSRAARGKLRALNALGCSVAAAVPARWPDPRGLATTVTEWGDDAGVGIVPIGVRGDPAEPEKVSWDRRSLRRLLKDFRPDIIQVEEEPWSRAAARTVAEARRLRIPVVGFSWLSLPRAYDLRERLRRRRVLRGIAGTVAGSPQAASLLERARPGLPVTIIPQLGTAAASAAQRVEGPLALGCIGRLVPEKGLDILFRASVKVLGEWTLDVAGTGPAQVELEALAERLGISARITWHGALPRSALEPVWGRINCLVVPSRATRDWVEIQAPTVIEAMGRGIPVVATDTGALRHIIGAGGIIVPEDDGTALADALGTMLEDPHERARLGSEGRRRVMAEFTSEAVARRQLEFWRSLRFAQAIDF
jgi:glycosyltransferase involved in cell wall biosynthesis